MWNTSRSLNGFFMFSIFTVYGIFMAYAGPRLFAGNVDVVPVRAIGYGALTPLAPTSSNITQACYMFVSWVFTLALAADLAINKLSAAVDEFARAILAALTIMCITGFIDILGGKALLEPFRNGSYALAGYTFLGGLGRITGTFSEASAYGAAAVTISTMAYFLRSGIHSSILRLYVAPVAIGFGYALAAASTSSTAYAGLLVSFVVVIASPHFATATDKRQWFTMLLVSTILLTIGCSVLILIVPDFFSIPLHVLDEAILKKNQTSSYVERNSWTAVGYAVFWKSFGLGTGPGSIRVSSWAAAVASNVGLVGIVAMSWTLFQAYLRKGNPKDRVQNLLRLCGKTTLSVVLAMGYLSGTTVDPGIFMSTALAIIWVGSLKHPVIEELERRKRSRHVPHIGVTESGKTLQSGAAWRNRRTNLSELESKA
jgi:hypothetical protein